MEGTQGQEQKQHTLQSEKKKKKGNKVHVFTDIKHCTNNDAVEVGSLIWHFNVYILFW